jgi:hypothetical protein
MEVCRQLTGLEQELAGLARLRHPNILAYVGLVREAFGLFTVKTNFYKPPLPLPISHGKVCVPSVALLIFTHALYVSPFAYILPAIITFLLSPIFLTSF